MTISGERDHHATCGVEAGVGGTENGSQENGIDDMDGGSEASEAEDGSDR